MPGNYCLARGHFGARFRSLDRRLSIGSQPGCFRSVCVDRQTVWPDSYAADDTALVRLRDEGRHGRTTGRRGRYSKFSNWSNGKRRACCVPRYLHEYCADLASPRRRSCHGLGWRELESRLSWGLVLTVGASLSLSQAMVHTGTADWLGRSFLLVLTGVTQSPLTLLTGIIICVAMVHLAITNLAACIALLVPITMTIAKTAGVNPIVCALAVTIVIDSVILYPVQTAANLIAYESGYFGTADVGRLGFAMLGLTIFVSLCIAVPYWSALGLPLISG
jgi:hypothetical protein